MALITLANLATLVGDFDSYFDGNNIPFVILGNTAQHVALANAAANLAVNSNITIHVPYPIGLYGTLLTYVTHACVLPPVYDPNNLFAVAISPSKMICYVMNTYDPASITIATMEAEAH